MSDPDHGQQFKLDNIGNFGELAPIFDASFQVLSNDCRNRPSVTKARRLTLTIDVFPDGPDNIRVDTDVKIKAPPIALPSWVMELNVRGQARFFPSSPSGRPAEENDD